MGRTVPEVTRLAGALAPPPRVSYRDLGDPELVGAPPTGRDRRRRRVSVSTIATVVVALALVLAVSRCVGPRPSLGPAPTRIEVRVGPDVPAQPSEGCDAPAVTTGTFVASARTADGVDVPYRLAVPPAATPTPTVTATSAPTTSTPTTTPGTAAATPRPLVLAVADTDQTADAFATTSGLEASGLDEGSLVATVAPPGAGSAAAVPATEAVLDSVLASACVDTARVTVAGLGSGGQAATALACSAPDRVAAVAAVGGASMPRDCELSPAVSLQLLWAADDRALPPTGGYGPEAVPPSDAAAPLPPSPAGEVTADWARALGADPPTRSTGPDGTAVEEARAADGAAVRWVTTPGGGHGWTSSTTTAVLLFAQEHARAT